MTLNLIVIANLNLRLIFGNDINQNHVKVYMFNLQDLNDLNYTGRANKLIAFS